MFSAHHALKSTHHADVHKNTKYIPGANDNEIAKVVNNDRKWVKANKLKFADIEPDWDNPIIGDARVPIDENTDAAVSPRIFRVWVGVNSGRDSGRFSGRFRALSGFSGPFPAGPFRVSRKQQARRKGPDWPGLARIGPDWPGFGPAGLNRNYGPRCPPPEIGFYVTVGSMNANYAIPSYR